jgi:2-dehydro-3-deoxyphosphooctonate aldolase (KDO 8-P synthase)
MQTRVVEIGGVRIGEGNPLALIAGPCALESEDVALETARSAAELAELLGVPFVFKSSYLKDNRQSPGSYSGPGLEAGLRILSRVKAELGVPVLSDVHERREIEAASDVLDAIQIPAFLCRQTRLVEDAARTGLPLNIKKGQFMAPEDMGSLAAKAHAAGNDSVLFTERGTTFGYHNLVVDMRSIKVMGELGYPVVFDATHSVQLPGGGGGVSGGQPQYVSVLSRAACAAGCDALFVETHPNPSCALSDAQSMIPLDGLRSLLEAVLPVAEVVRTHDTREQRPEADGTGASADGSIGSGRDD